MALTDAKASWRSQSTRSVLFGNYVNKIGQRGSDLCNQPNVFLYAFDRHLQSPRPQVLGIGARFLPSLPFLNICAPRSVQKTVAKHDERPQLLDDAAQLGSPLFVGSEEAEQGFQDRYARTQVADLRRDRGMLRLLFRMKQRADAPINLLLKLTKRENKLTDRLPKRLLAEHDIRG